MFARVCASVCTRTRSVHLCITHNTYLVEVCVGTCECVRTRMLHAVCLRTSRVCFPVQMYNAVQDLRGVSTANCSRPNKTFHGAIKPTGGANRGDIGAGLKVQKYLENLLRKHIHMGLKYRP